VPSESKLEVAAIKQLVVAGWTGRNVAAGMGLMLGDAMIGVGDQRGRGRFVVGHAGSLPEDICTGVTRGAPPRSIWQDFCRVVQGAN